MCWHEELSILFMLLKNKHLIHSYFLVSISLISALKCTILLFSYSLLFLKYLKIPQKLLYLNFLFFLIWALIRINFPLRTALIMTQSFQQVGPLLSLTSRKLYISSLISSVTHLLYRSMLLISQILPFPKFFCSWFLLHSGLRICMK